MRWLPAVREFVLATLLFNFLNIGAVFATPPQSIVGPTNNGASITAATVGESSASVLAAATNPITILVIQNESASANVAVCFVTSGSSCTAAINTAGSFMIAAGATLKWDSGNVPPNAIYAIASAASTPVTIERE